MPYIRRLSKIIEDGVTCQNRQVLHKGKFTPSNLAEVKSHYCGFGKVFGNIAFLPFGKLTLLCPAQPEHHSKSHRIKHGHAVWVVCSKDANPTPTIRDLSQQRQHRIHTKNPSQVLTMPQTKGTLQHVFAQIRSKSAPEWNANSGIERLSRCFRTQNR